jgi:hypothetical protein
MNIKLYLYVKKQKLSRYLALKLARNRSFSAMQLMLKTLRTNKMLPEKLIALDLFGFIGTTTTMDYAPLTEYLEMWEIDPYYAKEAKKNLPNANVVCGDSINAIKTGQLHRKEYNFIVIDANASSSFSDGSYESFGVFPHALNYIAQEAVIFVTIFSDLREITNLYGGSIEQLDPNWIKARKDFYQVENVIDARGIDYLKGFELIIKEKNIDLIHSQFINRNDSVGFGVFVVKKK